MYYVSTELSRSTFYSFTRFLQKLLTKSWHYLSMDTDEFVEWESQNNNLANKSQKKMESA